MAASDNENSKRFKENTTVDKGKLGQPSRQKDWEQYSPPYGDLGKLNTDRTILNSVGSETLKEIARDFIDLMETSAAVYERNGDYALGIFASGWCQYLDRASFGLCGTEDAQKALDSGKWLCHESCWSHAAKISMETQKPVDIECHGGIRIYAVPIFAGGKVVGSIDLGYGDPPDNPEKLRKLSEKYRADFDELAQRSKSYESRPRFVVELAKKRLHLSARLIGEIVEHKQAREALAREKAELQATLYGIGDGVISTDMIGRVARMNPIAEQLTGWSEADAVGKLVERVFTIINEHSRKPAESPITQVLREGTTCSLANHTLLISRQGKEIPIADSGAPILDDHGDISGVVLVFRDQTEERARKRLTETRISLIEYASEHNIDEFITEAIHKIGGLVGSPIGFFQLVEADRKNLSGRSWTSLVGDDFSRVEEKSIRYPVSDAGIRAQCVHEKKPLVHNYRGQLPHNEKAMPEGHGKLIRELLVPIVRSDKVAAIFGVGNKPVDYTENDVKLVSFLADVTWEVLRQKQGERDLKKSEEKYRLFFDSADVLVSVYNYDGICQLMNRKVASYFGGKPEDFIGKSFRQLHPGAAQIYMERVRRVIDSDNSAEYEDLVTFPEGRRWLLSTVHPLADIEGKPAAQIISQDITDRKLAQEALLREKDMAQKYLDIAGVIFVALDSKGVVTLVNQKGSEVLGYDREEILGRDWFENFLPEDIRSRVTEVYKSVMSGDMESVEYFENPVLTRNGEQRMIAWHNATLTDSGGKPIGVLSSGEDITERKRAEKALSESEERFRLLVETAPMPILLLQKNKFIFANPESARLLGYESPREIVGKEGLEIIAPEFQDIVRNRMERIEKGGKNPPMELRLIKPDGESVWAISTSVPVRIKGEPTAIVVGQDITERKRAEEEKARMETRFNQAQKLESIGRLAGGVAHDLNNLLSPILGYGEMLLEDLSEDDPRREALYEIVGAGARARDLVHRLLAFSRKQMLEFKSIELNRLLENFEKLLRRTIREDIAIEMDLSDSLPTVRGDKGQLEQVVMNLAVNAQDAMPDGGTLTITTDMVEMDESYAKQKGGVPPGKYVLLEVSDTGHGIDDTTREHLFEPFFTTKEKDQGTGLGLATVYGIVKQHGGSVIAYGEPDLGAVFKVYLPVAAAENQTTEQASEDVSPESEMGSETVLIVEDNQAVRNLASSVLSRRGYTVLEAKSGTEALSLLEAGNVVPDLLLTDVVMPKMNGKQLFRKVSSIYPDVKVLFMSGYTDNVIAHRGIMDEGVSFIQKPFSIKSLREKVRQVLDMPR